MSQLKEDVHKLWSGSKKQVDPNEWVLHDMENFNLCIQLYANVMIDLIYDIRFKLKLLKDYLFPVNLDVCSDPEDQTKMPSLKWYILMRYIRRKKKRVCKLCSGPCLKNVFLILESLEKDLFQWEKSVFKFSEERPDEDYNRVIKEQHKKWDSKYSPISKLESLILRTEVASSRPPKPRRSSSLVNLSHSELLHKYRNTSFLKLFKGIKPKASSSKTLKNEILLQNDNVIHTTPNVLELPASEESNEAAIFLKPKLISFSIDKILSNPYVPPGSSSQVAQQENPIETGNLSENPFGWIISNPESTSISVVVEQESEPVFTKPSKDPSKSTYLQTAEHYYANPVAGPSNSKDHESSYCGPRRSLSSSSLYDVNSGVPFLSPADDKAGNEFQSKAYAFINENGTEKMTNETYKYILFFRMRMLSNKLMNYIQNQPDLFDIYAEVQS
ncbi:PREDICTED: uncharacterized protein LOC108565318 isoform X1 [Nicrophorus vespilloides]|uniref:Uncharacterized protein LOC108565318 isoform X1 n=1 Tax=Nicrophorus vespilloides TaxID=110193 RepID=A0ABM1N048_NICVS|nr:PREDICTED: uncharacterized protein LOC108565318 isoform X1 [Nicrophorus vespilloides]